MPTEQTDRRTTPDRYIDHAFRYEHGQRNKTNNENKTLESAAVCQVQANVVRLDATQKLCNSSRRTEGLKKTVLRDLQVLCVSSFTIYYYHE